MTLQRTIREHLPEYLIEAWALGMFMVSAGLATILLEYPESALRAAIQDADIRRILIGIAMGLTAMSLIYSPWGKRSGAHMNPAVTLSFLRLGKIAPIDAMFYVLAQFSGGLLGVLAIDSIFGAVFELPPVNYVATLPAMDAVGTAFAAEFAISFGLMLTILFVSNSIRLAAATGLFAGLLVAFYISVEAPLSGMSMNPARSLASAAPAGLWNHLWIYFTAPVLGMVGAAELYLRIRGIDKIHCAKLQHSEDQRCIHCGFEPEQSNGRSAVIDTKP